MSADMVNRTKALRYAQSKRQEFLNDLKSFLRIPSISTQSDHKSDMRIAAEWLAQQLHSSSLQDVQVMSTSGHPIVYGMGKCPNPGAPTILVYGHYDVQPVDPLDLWKSDPFEPVIRDDWIFARGASDMKSLVLAHLKATQSIIATGQLPVNLKYLIEGEEEIGSPSIRDFLTEHRDQFQCDLCLNLDAGILGPETPSLTYGLRGIQYLELRVRTNSVDLHSGRFGGIVRNAGQVLSELIAGMKDANGRIRLPGFYEDVRELTNEEISAMRKLPSSEDWWREKAEAWQLWGEAGYSPTARASVRPTLEVNGLLCGYTGEGSKSVLPAEAMAKISLRLVPDQEPERVVRLFQKYLGESVPQGVEWELEVLHSGRPVVIDLKSGAVKAAGRALEAVWKKRPLFWRAGGTIALLGIIEEILGVDILMLGFFMHDDNIHAPNERFYLPNYYRGIETYIHFAHEFAEGEAARK